MLTATISASRKPVAYLTQLARDWKQELRHSIVFVPTTLFADSSSTVWKSGSAESLIREDGNKLEFQPVADPTRAVSTPDDLVIRVKAAPARLVNTSEFATIDIGIKAVIPTEDMIVQVRQQSSNSFVNHQRDVRVRIADFLDEAGELELRIRCRAATTKERASVHFAIDQLSIRIVQ